MLPEVALPCSYVLDMFRTKFDNETAGLTVSIVR